MNVGNHQPPQAFASQRGKISMECVAHAEPDHHRRQGLVLVVEDEVIIRTNVSEDLRAAGLEVMEAATGDEAIALVESGLPIDLVLTDVRMPGSLDGLELARVVRRKRPMSKIVVVSGNLAARPTPDLADAFLTKPYSLLTVVEVVRGLLAEPRP